MLYVKFIMYILLQFIPTLFGVLILMKALLFELYSQLRQNLVLWQACIIILDASFRTYLIYGT